MKANGSPLIIPFRSNHGNGYLLPFADGYIAVDPATVPMARRMVAYVLRQAQHPSAIRIACATHTHAEHIGGMEELQRLTQCEIHLHHQARHMPRGAADRPHSRLQAMRRRVRSILLDPVSFLERAGEEQPAKASPAGPEGERSWRFRVSTWLQHGSTLPGGWTVLYTPGHTPDSICLYHRRGKVLIAGDTLTCQDDGLELNPDASQEEVMDLTVRALHDLPVSTIYLGRGEPRVGSSVLRHALHKPPQNPVQRRIHSLLA